MISPCTAKRTCKFYFFLIGHYIQAWVTKNYNQTKKEIKLYHLDFTELKRKYKRYHTDYFIFSLKMTSPCAEYKVKVTLIQEFSWKNVNVKILQTSQSHTRHFPIIIPIPE